MENYLKSKKRESHTTKIQTDNLEILKSIVIFFQLSKLHIQLKIYSKFDENNGGIWEKYFCWWNFVVKTAFTKNWNNETDTDNLIGCSNTTKGCLWK